MNIKYRLAKMEDLDKICAMVSRSVSNMHAHQIDQWDEVYPNRDVFEEDIQKSQLYVGSIADEIVVIYVLNQECDEDYQKADWKYCTEPFYVIHRLCIDPKWQKQGIGKYTMQCIEEEVKKRGVFLIHMDTFTENPFALRLYENAGYQKTGFVEWRKGRFVFLEKHL